MNKDLIINFVLFQALWMSCVVAAGGYGLGWVAVLALVPITIHALTLPTRITDFKIAAIAVVIGFALDTGWAAMGLLDFKGAALAPFWIAFLWYGFGLSISTGLSPFRDRGWLGAAIVGIFAPVTYLAGERFDAVTVPAVAPLLVISVSWALLFQALATYSRRSTEAEGHALGTDAT